MKIREQKEEIETPVSSNRENDRQEIVILNGEGRVRGAQQPYERYSRNKTQKEFEFSPKNLKRVREEALQKRREAFEEDREKDELREDKFNEGNVSFRDRVHKTESLQQSTPEKKTEKRKEEYVSKHVKSEAQFRVHSALENPTFTQSEETDENLELFLAIISNLARHEINLEIAKKNLISRKDFVPLKLFDQIDKKRRGWFTMEDFKNYLSSIGLRDVDTRFLLDLYSSHDLNHNCLLNLHEFTNMIASENPEYLQMLDRPVTDREKVEAA